MTHTAALDALGGCLAAKALSLSTLESMTPTQRLAAYRRGDFSFDQCCLWAARYPREVPLIDGEFEFLAINTPEVCE